MTLHDWISVLLTVLGGFGLTFAFVWKEGRKLHDRAATAKAEAAKQAEADKEKAARQAELDKKEAANRADLEKAAFNAKLDVIERGYKDADYQSKKDVLDKIKEERDILHDRCDQIETDHAADRTEFTAELRSIVETFTRTCDGMQAKLEHLTQTIIGQYVPRSEIDARNVRQDEKLDRVLTALYDMKK